MFVKYGARVKYTGEVNPAPSETDTAGYRDINVIVKEQLMAGRELVAFREGYYDWEDKVPDDFSLPRTAQLLRSAHSDPSEISQEALIVAERLRRSKELGVAKRKLELEKQQAEREAFNAWVASGRPSIDTKTVAAEALQPDVSS